MRNGVDLQRFQPVPQAQARQATGTCGAPLLLSVGNLVEIKGHHLVIDALVLLVERHPDAGLVIVGEGAERTRLEQRVQERGVRSRVTFTGAIPNHQLAAWYSAADMLVLASTREGWANVLLEAMAYGARPTRDIAAVMLVILGRNVRLQATVDRRRHIGLDQPDEPARRIRLAHRRLAGGLHRGAGDAGRLARHQCRESPFQGTPVRWLLAFCAILSLAYVDLPHHEMAIVVAIRMLQRELPAPYGCSTWPARAGGD